MFLFPDQRSQLAPHLEEPTSRDQQPRDQFIRTSISAENMSSEYSQITVSQTEQRKHAMLSHSTSDQRLSQSHNAAQFASGIKNFQKSHRRMRSHENVSILRSLDTDSSSSCSMSNKSEDDVFVSRNNPDTMTDLLKKTDEMTTNNLLPDGWQEVQDETETYFWHIWTGTIQYERPSLAAVRPHLFFFLFFRFLIIKLFTIGSNNTIKTNLTTGLSETFFLNTYTFI